MIIYIYEKYYVATNINKIYIPLEVYKKYNFSGFIF